MTSSLKTALHPFLCFAIRLSPELKRLKRVFQGLLLIFHPASIAKNYLFMQDLNFA